MYPKALSQTNSQNWATYIRNNIIYDPIWKIQLTDGHLAVFAIRRTPPTNNTRYIIKILLWHCRVEAFDDGWSAGLWCTHDGSVECWSLGNLCARVWEEWCWASDYGLVSRMRMLEMESVAAIVTRDEGGLATWRVPSARGHFSPLREFGGGSILGVHPAPTTLKGRYYPCLFFEGYIF